MIYSEDAASLSLLASGLKSTGHLPRHIEFSKLGSVHMAAAYDEVRSKIISESIVVGMDKNPDLAALKALVELVERKAYKDGARSGISACQTERSDGFAAFPTSNVNARLIARANAYQEAVERFAWTSWWDNAEIAYTTNQISISAAEPDLIRNIHEITPIRECVEILPKIQNSKEFVVIYFAFLEPFGVISGGACGTADTLDHAQFRACCELTRHALAVHRMKEQGLAPSTFYEQRLAFFGLRQEGETQLRMRLKANGGSSIKLPPLAIDAEISHSLESLVYVHRCLFENQPPFVGGALERLCL